MEIICESGNNVLGNKKDNGFKILEEELLMSYGVMECKPLFKIPFIHSHLNFLQKILSRLVTN